MVGVSQYKLDQIDLVVRRKLSNKTNQEIVTECRHLWPDKDWENKHVSYIFGKHKDQQRYKPQGGQLPPWEPILKPAAKKLRAEIPENPKSRTRSPPIRKPRHKNPNEGILASNNKMDVPNSDGLRDGLPRSNAPFYQEDIPYQTQIETMQPNLSLGQIDIVRSQQGLGYVHHRGALPMGNPVSGPIPQAGNSVPSTGFNESLAQPYHSYDMPLNDSSYLNLPGNFNFNRSAVDDISFPAYGANEDSTADATSLYEFPKFMDDFGMPSATYGEGIIHADYGRKLIEFEANTCQTSAPDASGQSEADNGLSTISNAPGMTAQGELVQASFGMDMSNFEAQKSTQTTYDEAQGSTEHNFLDNSSRPGVREDKDEPMREQFVLGSPSLSEKNIFDSTPVRQREMRQQAAYNPAYLAPHDFRKNPIPLIGDSMPSSSFTGFHPNSFVLAQHQAAADGSSNGLNVPWDPTTGHPTGMHGLNAGPMMANFNFQRPMELPNSWCIPQPNRTVIDEPKDVTRRLENIDHFQTAEPRTKPNISNADTGGMFSVNMQSVKRCKDRAVSPSPRPHIRKRRMEAQIQQELQAKRSRGDTPRSDTLPSRNIDFHNPSQAQTSHETGNYPHADLSLPKNCGYSKERGYYSLTSSWPEVDGNVIATANVSQSGFNSSFNQENRPVFDQKPATNRYHNQRTASNAVSNTVGNMPVLPGRHGDNRKAPARLLQPPRRFAGNDQSRLQVSQGQPRVNSLQGTASNATIYGHNNLAAEGYHHASMMYNNGFQSCPVPGPYPPHQGGYQRQPTLLQGGINIGMGQGPYEFHPGHTTQNQNNFGAGSSGSGGNTELKREVNKAAQAVNQLQLNGPGLAPNARLPAYGGNNFDPNLDPSVRGDGSIFQYSDPLLPAYVGNIFDPNLDAAISGDGRVFQYSFPRFPAYVGNIFNPNLNPALTGDAGGPQYSNPRLPAYAGNNPNLDPALRGNARAFTPAPRAGSVPDTSSMVHPNYTGWKLQNPANTGNQAMQGQTIASQPSVADGMEHLNNMLQRAKERYLSENEQFPSANLAIASSHLAAEPSSASQGIRRETGAFALDPSTTTDANEIHAPQPGRLPSEAASSRSLLSESPMVMPPPPVALSSSQISGEWGVEGGVAAQGQHQQARQQQQPQGDFSSENIEGGYDFEQDVEVELFNFNDPLGFFQEDDLSHDDIANLLD